MEQSLYRFNFSLTHRWITPGYSQIVPAPAGTKRGYKCLYGVITPIFLILDLGINFVKDTLHVLISGASSCIHLRSRWRQIQIRRDFPAFFSERFACTVRCVKALWHTVKFAAYRSPLTYLHALPNVYDVQARELIAYIDALPEGPTKAAARKQLATLYSHLLRVPHIFYRADLLPLTHTFYRAEREHLNAKAEELIAQIAILPEGQAKTEARKRLSALSVALPPGAAFIQAQAEADILELASSTNMPANFAAFDRLCRERNLPEHADFVFRGIQAFMTSMENCSPPEAEDVEKLASGVICVMNAVQYILSPAQRQQLQPQLKRLKAIPADIANILLNLCAQGDSFDLFALLQQVRRLRFQDKPLSQLLYNKIRAALQQSGKEGCAHWVATFAFEKEALANSAVTLTDDVKQMHSAVWWQKLPRSLLEQLEMFDRLKKTFSDNELKTTQLLSALIYQAHQHRKERPLIAYRVFLFAYRWWQQAEIIEDRAAQPPTFQDYKMLLDIFDDCATIAQAQSAALGCAQALNPQLLLEETVVALDKSNGSLVLPRLEREGSRHLSADQRPMTLETILFQLEAWLQAQITSRLPHGHANIDAPMQIITSLMVKLQSQPKCDQLAFCQRFFATVCDYTAWVIQRPFHDHNKAECFINALGVIKPLIGLFNLFTAQPNHELYLKEALETGNNSLKAQRLLALTALTPKKYLFSDKVAVTQAGKILSLYWTDLEELAACELVEQFFPLTPPEVKAVVSCGQELALFAETISSVFSKQATLLQARQFQEIDQELRTLEPYLQEIGGIWGIYHAKAPSLIEDRARWIHDLPIGLPAGQASRILRALFDYALKGETAVKMNAISNALDAVLNKQHEALPTFFEWWWSQKLSYKERRTEIRLSLVFKFLTLFSDRSLAGTAAIHSAYLHRESNPLEALELIDISLVLFGLGLGDDPNQFLLRLPKELRQKIEAVRTPYATCWKISKVGSLQSALKACPEASSTELLQGLLCETFRWRIGDHRPWPPLKEVFQLFGDLKGYLQDKPLTEATKCWLAQTVIDETCELLEPISHQQLEEDNAIEIRSFFSLACSLCISPDDLATHLKSYLTRQPSRLYEVCKLAKLLEIRLVADTRQLRGMRNGHHPHQAFINSCLISSSNDVD